LKKRSKKLLLLERAGHGLGHPIVTKFFCFFLFTKRRLLAF